jgi:O-antigen/teichoic acid export membrane protein
MALTSNSVFARGVFTSGVAIGLMGLVNYFSRRTLALGLSAEDFAFFYGGYSLVMLFGSCMDFGSGSALNILIPKFQVRNKISALRVFTATGLGMRLLASCAMGALLLLAAAWLSRHVYHYPAGWKVLMWTIVMLPFFSTFCFLIDVCSSFHEFALRNWLSVIQMALVFVGIVILLPSCGPLAPPIAFIVSYLISLPAGALLMIRKYPFLRPQPAFSFPLMRRLWRLSRWFFLVSVGTAIFNNLDILVLARFSTLHSLALYNVAIPVMQIFQCLLVVPAIFMPVAARLWQHGNHKELEDLYKSIQAFLLAASGACILFTVVDGEWLLGFLFKKDFGPAAPILSLLTAGLFFTCMAQINFSLLATIGKPEKIAGPVLSGAFLCVAGSLVGVFCFDSAGVAAARSLAMAAMFLISQFHLSRQSSLGFSWKLGILTLCITGVLWGVAAAGIVRIEEGLRLGLFLLAYGVLASPLLIPMKPLMKGLMARTS